MRGRYLLGRLAFSLAVVWIVVTAVFLVIAYAPDMNLQSRLAVAAYSGANLSELQALQETYLRTRGRTMPLVERYLAWVASVVVLDWGYSVVLEQSVLSAILGSLGRTAAYVVPGMLLATIGGTVAGTLSAWRRGSLGERATRLLTYVAFGLPSFFVGGVLFLLVEGDMTAAGPSGVASLTGQTAAEPASFVLSYLLPTVTLALSLVAGQLSYARSLSMEYVNAPFVRAMRAKGLAPHRILWRVLRNAIVPMLSVQVTELLSILVLNVFVIEFLFNVGGLGELAYVAVHEFDVPLMLGVTMAIVILGVIAGLAKDVAATRLDPRYAEG